MSVFSTAGTAQMDREPERPGNVYVIHQDFTFDSAIFPIMSLPITAATTQSPPELAWTQFPLEPELLKNEELTRVHSSNDFDWRLNSTLIRFLSRLGTGKELHVDEDPTTGASSCDDSDDKSGLRAVAAPQTLYHSSGSMTDFVQTFPTWMPESTTLHYYLQPDEGVLPRIAGLDQQCNDIRGLFSNLNNHWHARRPWRSDLRAILPGLLAIDCLSRQVVSVDQDCSYVALSYVWGGTGAISSGGFTTNLRGCRIPRTIRDAMNVIKVLGLRYLWVDRYCINNTDLDIKHHMIRNMDSIYEAAYLTIIAASGDDGDQGLPSVSRTIHGLDTDTTPLWDGLVYSEFSGPHLEQFENSVYSTRGWTYQEDLLSQRRLIFTNNRTTLCYGGKDRIRRGDGIFTHINQYTWRRLKYPSDQLNAFLGVFRAYERLKPPVKHIWGLPFLLDRASHMRHPGYGLLWRAHRNCSLYPISGQPSWIWAGWNGWSFVDGEQVSRWFQLGPYDWLVKSILPQRHIRVWEPSDISLEVQVGAQLVEVSDYFRPHHTPTFGKMKEPAPVLYVTAWLTTVSVRVSITACISFLDEDMSAAQFTIDPIPEALYKGGPLANGHWTCQWTAAVICWGVKRDYGRELLTQSLLLERAGEDTFRRVGVLDTNWRKSDLDGHGRIPALDRNFTRMRVRME